MIDARDDRYAPVELKCHLALLSLGRQDVCSQWASSAWNSTATKLMTNDAQPRTPGRSLRALVYSALIAASVNNAWRQMAVSRIMSRA